jgi:hypothetical protein
MKNHVVLLAALLVSGSNVFAAAQTVDCGPLLPTQELTANATFMNVGEAESHVILLLPFEEASLKKYSGKCNAEAGPLLPSLTCRVDVSEYEYTVTLADRGEHGLMATFAPSESMEIPTLLACRSR